MRHCINFRHPDVVLLAKEISMPAFIVANMIAVWQENNKIFDRFPNAEEVLTVKEEPSARALPFEQAIAEFKRKYHVKEIYRDYETVSKMIKTARKNGKYDHIHFGIDKNSTGFWPTYNRKDEFYSLSPSAKNGYSKVWLPTGNTSAKVEGHTTLEEFKKQKEDRIKELEKRLSKLEKDNTQGSLNHQKLTQEEKAKTIEQVTKEHRSITALKDLSAKLAYRIGGKT